MIDCNEDFDVVSSGLLALTSDADGFISLEAVDVWDASNYYSNDGTIVRLVVFSWLGWFAIDHQQYSTVNEEECFQTICWYSYLGLPKSHILRRNIPCLRWMTQKIRRK